MPKTNFDQYFDVELDSTQNVLVAMTGLGFRHVIDLKDGHVIEYSLVK
jgi:hypothetical protein